jgi:hypothetical protein
MFHIKAILLSPHLASNRFPDGTQLFHWHLKSFSPCDRAKVLVVWKLENAGSFLGIGFTILLPLG